MLPNIFQIGYSPTATTKSTPANPHRKYIKRLSIVDLRWTSNQMKLIQYDFLQFLFAPIHLMDLESRRRPVNDYLNREKHSTTQLSYLAKHGSNFYLQGLHTHPTKGLTDQQAQENQKKYGKNVLAKKRLKTMMEIFCETLDDLMLKILIAAAVVSIITEAIYSQDRKTFWLQGVTILAAVAVCSIVATVNNYQKQLQFEELNDISDKSNKFDVMRDGHYKQIERTEIVVGDLILISSGLQIPVDGIALRANDLIVDESSMTGESHEVYKDIIEKSLQHGEHNKKAPSPIILSGSKIMSGEGTLLCLLVGKESRQGEINELIQEDNEQNTPLQQRLEDLAEKIGWFGLISGVVLFLVLFVWLIFSQVIPNGWDSSKHIGDILSYLMLGVTLIVVAVPEGLPLAVTLSLAFSVKQMLQEKNLVKRLACCETMGSAHVICTDKTGTLTQNDMNIVQIWNGVSHQSNLTTAPFAFEDKKFADEYKDLIFTAICTNSTSVLKPNPKGSATEIALLKYADKFYSNKDLFAQRCKSEQSTFLRFPFNSDRKRLTTGMNFKGKPVIILTGGSEIVIGACNHMFNLKHHKITPLIKQEVDDEIESLTKRGLRVVAIAVKDKVPIPSKEQIENKDKFGVRPLETQGFTLLMLAGIQDLLRPESKQAIKNCNTAGVVVIMVTGDNSVTARAVGDEIGITKAGDLTPGLCMEGAEFEKLQQNLSPQEFYEKVKHLKILARSRPEHKLKLVQGLKKLNNIVAVTGDGTNDAPALLKANVGVAMGISGTQVAKNAADVLILDDNFNSIVRSIVWGRNIYDSIKKFLQFQLTVNVVACFFSIIASTLFKQSVFTTVQMLWVNMIMDSLASLALSTDPPNTEELLRRKPVNRGDSLITRTMIKHILIQSTYQITVLLFLVLSGQNFLPQYADEYDTLIGSDLSAKYYNGQLQGTMTNGLNHPLFGESYQPHFQKYHVYSRHLTFVFNVFVFLQIFNFFSCRKINDELNIFSGLFTNYIFWIMFVFIVLFQWIIIYLLNEYFNCYKFHGLSIQQWGLSILIGATVIPLSLLIRLLPFAKPDPLGQINTDANDLQFRESDQASSQDSCKDEKE